MQLALQPLLFCMQPPWIPACGGTEVKLMGANFVGSKHSRIAFLWGAKNLVPCQSARAITIVAPCFDSHRSLSCIAPRCTGSSGQFSLLIANNGKDFDSFSCTNELYVYDPPVIHSITAADGIFTTKLRIEGVGFIHTGFEIASFTYKNALGLTEIQYSDVDIISCTIMECKTPNIEPGTVVQVAVALNGIDFVCSRSTESIRMFNAPIIADIRPSWIHQDGGTQMDIIGANFLETGRIKV